MKYQVWMMEGVRKSVERLPLDIQDAINEAILSLERFPTVSNITRLRGYDNTWRKRVGNYRIVFEVQNQALVVMVVKVGHRKDVYG